jgi:hypothetical protein
VLPLNPNVALQRVYAWTDLNLNRDYDAGEVDFNQVIQEVGRGNAAIANVQSNPDQPQTSEDQYSLGLERELKANMAVRVTGLYSRRYNVIMSKNLLRGPETYTIANTRPDPGPDGNVATTADNPGTSLTWWEYPDAYRPFAFQLNTLVGVPESREIFKTIEVAGTKRLSHGWQLLASFSATNSDIPVPAEANINPNTYILSANNTWEWLGRVSGAYVFPANVMVSVSSENRSGDVQARTVNLTGGGTIPTFLIRAEPIGSLRLPTQHTMDIRFSKRFNLAHSQKFEVQANLFNIFNANTVTARTVQSGVNYLRPTAIQAARIADFNIAYSF